jgi:hypothetical protein
VENAQVPVEEVMGIDISSTLFALGSFVSRFDNRLSYRIQTKYCALCDCVCDRADALTLRKDTGTRQNILHLITEWIQNPVPVSHSRLTSWDRTHLNAFLFFFYQAGDLDSARIIELNICCLRTAVKLLDRLQLKPLDGSSGDDSGHAVSRLFGQYSSILLKGLKMCNTDDSVSRFLPTYDTFSSNLTV